MIGPDLSNAAPGLLPCAHYVFKQVQILAFAFKYKSLPSFPESMPSCLSVLATLHDSGLKPVLPLNPCHGLFIAFCIPLLPFFHGEWTSQRGSGERRRR
jgi:hypothetical protein